MMNVKEMHIRMNKMYKKATVGEENINLSGNIQLLKASWFQSAQAP